MRLHKLLNAIGSFFVNHRNEKAKIEVAEGNLILVGGRDFFVAFSSRARELSTLTGNTYLFYIEEATSLLGEKGIIEVLYHYDLLLGKLRRGEAG